MPSNWLSVPLFQQEFEYSCVAACALMVLAHFGESRSEAELRLLLDTQPSGTLAGNLMRLSGTAFEDASEETRLELLAALAELSRTRLEWHLGQLIANLAMTAGRLDSGGVWDLEDLETLAAARTLIEQHYEAEPEVAEVTASEERGTCKL